MKINKTNLTIEVKGVVTRYKSIHALNTAWLHHRILTERLDYVTYSKRYNAINNIKSKKVK